MLNNYRTAIKDTYAILNQNVSPGLLIIPSSLIILKKPIPGYNNTVRISDMSMRFGTNKDLNKEQLRLAGGGDFKPKSGLMTPKEHGASRGRAKRGTSSSALDDLKSASDNIKRGTLLVVLGMIRIMIKRDPKTTHCSIFFSLDWLEL